MEKSFLYATYTTCYGETFLPLDGVEISADFHTTIIMGPSSHRDAGVAAVRSDAPSPLLKSLFPYAIRDDDRDGGAATMLNGSGDSVGVVSKGIAVAVWWYLGSQSFVFSVDGGHDCMC